MRSFGCGFLIALTFVVLTPFVYSSAQTPEVVLYVPDTSVSGQTQNALLNIYIDNYHYEIFGFQFVLRSSNPDLLKFDFSHGGFDSTGTLTSGFEYMQAIDRAHDQTELWFRCIADVFYVPGHRSGFQPQQGGIAIRVPVAVFASPQSLLDPTSLLQIETPTDFSDPYGYSIGVISDTIFDSTFWQCTNWQGDTCRVYQQLPDGSNGYDSVYVDTTPYGYLDTTQVILHSGSLTVSFITCDNDGNGSVDVSDLICMTQFMFEGLTVGDCNPDLCDYDSSGTLDVADLIALVDYMFGNGPPPM